MQAKMSGMRKLAVVGVVVAGLGTLCGCDLAGLGALGGLGGFDNFGGYGGYDDLANYFGDGGYTGSYFPDYGLYDPTADIQSVVDYRQDVMDWSNDGWDEYILQ